MIGVAILVGAIVVYALSAFIARFGSAHTVHLREDSTRLGCLADALRLVCIVAAVFGFVIALDSLY